MVTFPFYYFSTCHYCSLTELLTMAHYLCSVSPILHTIEPFQFFPTSSKSKLEQYHVFKDLLN